MSWPRTTTLFGSILVMAVVHDGFAFRVAHEAPVLPCFCSVSTTARRQLAERIDHGRAGVAQRLDLAGVRAACCLR